MRQLSRLIAAVSLALLPAAPPSAQRGNHATVLLGFFDEVQRRLDRR